MKKTIYIIIPILICLLSGYVAQGFQVEAIADWYPTLNKSPLSPPNYLFGIVWTILYVLMGLSIGLIFVSKNENKRNFIILFGIQLGLNFLWSILFFYLQNTQLALLDIFFLDIVVLYYIVKTYRTARISSLLFVPYMLWIAFASYLNLYVVLYN